jgi:hypothetical protein
VTPEVFATWSVARSGQVTAGTASVIGDHTVTMTVAFVPLALVTVPVQNFRLFRVNLLFVILLPVAYAASLHWGLAGKRVQAVGGGFRRQFLSRIHCHRCRLDPEPRLIGLDLNG